MTFARGVQSRARAADRQITMVIVNGHEGLVTHLEQIAIRWNHLIA